MQKSSGPASPSPVAAPLKAWLNEGNEGFFGPKQLVAPKRIVRVSPGASAVTKRALRLRRAPSGA